MVDLTSICGDDALRASLIKKRDKVQEKLTLAIEKANQKIAPLENEIEKLDALLQVLAEHGKKPAETVSDIQASESPSEEKKAEEDVAIGEESDSLPAYLRKNAASA